MFTQLNVYGIQESRKVGIIAGATIGSIKNLDANKDGKASTLEIFGGLQTVAMSVISNTPDIKMLKKEATDYTEEEKDELVTLISQGVGITKRRAAFLFEKAVSIILDVVDFVIDSRKTDEELFGEAT